jgi:hypothetical protein
MARKNHDHAPGGLSYVVLLKATLSELLHGQFCALTWEPLLYNAAEHAAFLRLMPILLEKTHTRGHNLCLSSANARLITGGAAFLRWRWTKLTNQRILGSPGQVIKATYSWLRINHAELNSVPRSRRLSTARSQVAHCTAEWGSWRDRARSLLLLPSVVRR